MVVFKSDSVSITHDISVVYSPNVGNQIIEVAFNNPNIIRSVYGLEGVKGCANGLLDELRCYASISSLEEVGLPDFALEDTNSERITKAGSYEWNTSRFELVVCKKDKHSINWAEFGIAALKNASGFRYRISRLLDLTTDNIGARLGEWGRIGIYIQDVGFGVPKSFDKITITGHWVQEFVFTQEAPTYVVINQYGNSVTSTPTPSPTPVAIPAFTLALTSGTSVVANNNDLINLTISNVPVGTALTGSWFKNGVDTGISESVAVTGSTISLSTSKLKDKLSGNYKLRLYYQDTGYLSNEVAVVVNPEITLSLPSGIATAETGSNTLITVIGKYFDRVGSAYIIYNWLKGSTVAYTSSGAISIDIQNGSFSLTLPANQLQAATSGDYQFRLYLDNASTTPYLSKNTIPIVITNPSSVSISPTSVNTYNGTGYTFTVSLAYLVQGEPLNNLWLRNDVEIANTAQTKTYNTTTNTMNYNVLMTSFYSTASIYRLKVTRANGSVLLSNTCNIYYQFDGGGLG